MSLSGKSKKMEKIALFLKAESNLQLLVNELQNRYQLLIPDSEKDLWEDFDLAIIDGYFVNLLDKRIALLRHEVRPLFLPFLFITGKKDIGYATRFLWKVIDEIIFVPIEKVELQARIEILLRARRYSVQIKNRLEDMEILAHAIGHDLKAPLRSIETFTSYIKQDCSERLTDTHKDYIDRILKAIKRMSEIQDAIYTYMSAGCKGIVKESLSLENVVKNVLDEIQGDIQKREASVKVIKNIQFVSDIMLMKLILKNLIENALKFVERDRSPIVEISGYKKGDYVVIEVSDNGIGIPEDRREEIFKPFFRLHSDKTYPGTGLGLSIVKKCVDMLAGSIKVRSKKGGTTFVLDFLEKS